MKTPFSGKCQCGAVTYKCGAKPLFTLNCFCSACQRTSGAAYVATLRVPAAALQITGEVWRTTRIGDSGKEVESGFCARCGSRMFSFAESLGDSVGLFAASLDDQRSYRAQINIYVSKAPPWHEVDLTIPSFATVPSAEEAGKLLADANAM